MLGFSDSPNDNEIRIENSRRTAPACSSAETVRYRT